MKLRLALLLALSLPALAPDPQKRIAGALGFLEGLDESLTA